MTVLALSCSCVLLKSGQVSAACVSGPLQSSRKEEHRGVKEERGTCGAIQPCHTPPKPSISKHPRLSLGQFSKPTQVYMGASSYPQPIMYNLVKLSLSYQKPITWKLHQPQLEPLESGRDAAAKRLEIQAQNCGGDEGHREEREIHDQRVGSAGSGLGLFTT